jgi:hypothetical protein
MIGNQETRTRFLLPRNKGKVFGTKKQGQCVWNQETRAMCLEPRNKGKVFGTKKQGQGFCNHKQGQGFPQQLFYSGFIPENKILNEVLSFEMLNPDQKCYPSSFIFGNKTSYSEVPISMRSQPQTFEAFIDICV